MLLDCRKVDAEELFDAGRRHDPRNFDHLAGCFRVFFNSDMGKARLLEPCYVVIQYKCSADTADVRLHILAHGCRRFDFQAISATASRPPGFNTR